ncbi:MAG: OmpA family protein [Deltaproteobacteria bacterium]|nr:OmpA family protein [Deltaproteobacteria bacterium]
MSARSALCLAFGVALGLLCPPNSALAQPTPSFDSQRYLPAGNTNGFLVVPEAHVLPKLKFGFDVQLNFAYRPLQLLSTNQQREGAVIDALFAGHARVGFAPTDWIQVDLKLPFMQFASTGSGLSQLNGNTAGVFSLGDLWLEGRFRLLREEKHVVSVALMPFVTFPTGNPRMMLSSGVPTFGAQAALSRVIWRFRLAGAIGYRFKLGNPGYLLLGDRVAADDEILYSAGLGFAIVPERLDVNLELFGTGIVGPGRSPGVVTDYPGKGSLHSPLEALVDFRIQLAKGFSAVVGGGWGITTGVGTPAFRVIAGVSYAPSRDRDGDGILDGVDECPEVEEDMDGFEDEDGCPEVDNDEDGVVDGEDGCPLDPEDVDQFEDADGCPDPDNDGDTFLDGVDDCPDAAEDVDQFEDGDGCPDPDNDADGVPDADDACPNAPEDLDTWEDEDGCPDEDNDGDGFLDADDLCPLDAENVNDFKDDDGCPDDTIAVVKDDKIVILDKILFVTAKDVILRRSYPILEAVKNTILDNPRILKVRIEGHTDDRGSDGYNQRLSDQRAAAILRYLIAAGVSAERLESVGYGEVRPIDSNDTADGRERNRRVEFTILEFEKLIEQQGVDLPAREDKRAD